MESEIVAPSYKDYIDAALLRRMSKILRMSVACAKECIEQANIEQPDSIVVGTGLGCLQDTEKFLNTFLTVEGLLPPTSFIQSTHNTIAGQISLSLGNHGYNMTHTQNTVSFEHALLDSELLLNEMDQNVLVGAADEAISILDDIKNKWGWNFDIPLTSGASFFVLSKNKSDRTLAKLLAVDVVSGEGSFDTKLQLFLSENSVQATDIDLIMIPGLSGTAINLDFPKSEVVTYLPFSGIYPTASAFGLHYALDRMTANKTIRKVLVCNDLNRYHLGLTLLESVEA